MASFMQNINIYGYKALYRKSDPRFHFMYDRTTKGTRNVALRDLIYLVQNEVGKEQAFENRDGDICVDRADNLKL